MHYRVLFILCVLPCYALGMQQNTKTYGIVTDKTGKTMILVDPDYYISKKVKPSHYVVTSCSSAAGAMAGTSIGIVLGNLIGHDHKKSSICPALVCALLGSAIGGALGSFIGNYWESRPTNEADKAVCPRCEYSIKTN